MKPIWMQWAEKELGQHELPENRGPVVQKYINLSHCGELGDPWCAIFVNAALEANGIQGTRSPSSQSFRTDQNFVKLPGPALGAITVFWRTSPGSGLGHVGFYEGETPGYINTLGGNEQDAVRIELLAKASGHFGLRGYYWPKGQPMPTVGPIATQSHAIVGGKVV